MKINVANITFSRNTYLKNTLLEHFKDVTFNDKFQRLDYKNLSTFCDNSDVLVLGLEKFDEALFIENAKLKTIAKFGVGVDNIDFDILEKYNISLLHDIGVNKFEVAEFAYCQIVNLLRNITLTGNLLRRGEWLKDGGTSIQETKIGVIGVGNIGGTVVEKLINEGCKNIFIYDIDISKTAKYKNAQNVIITNLESLCEQSDLITFHIPGDKSNFEFLNSELIKKMKLGVKLLNISRGSLVSYDDILSNINSRHIYSYCTDVFPYEPYFDSRIVNNDRIICTPHIAGNSNQSVIKMGMSVINNLIKTFK